MHNIITINNNNILLLLLLLVDVAISSSTLMIHYYYYSLSYIILNKKRRNNTTTNNFIIITAEYDDGKEKGWAICSLSCEERTTNFAVFNWSNTATCTNSRGHYQEVLGGKYCTFNTKWLLRFLSSNTERGHFQRPIHHQNSLVCQ